MSDALIVDVVRVFTNDAGEFGNELGLVRSSPATEGREQQIATALGFSETVFIQQTDDARDVSERTDPAGGEAERAAVIRIFTPARELPFAGHPSVGCAWWLANGGSPVDVLAEKAGDVRVRYDGDLTWITGRAAWAPEFTWHPLATPGDVDALESSDFETGSNYAWAWVNEAEGIMRSRMFAPAMGIGEDEATGAAAVALTAQLGRDLDIRQGRGSRVLTRLGSDGDVHVAGRTVADPSRTISL
ncbi:PhzF family phenazine biosynthesis protein [Glaciihabitans sp. dw_435]|uniref:PhzF family phenazine biosynthesis protein n=1 Tax=Glaciihabitans sp. dw_435 TaxID=2720081 RepID=UPI001BD52BDD|nr:PhzF family phenazine biosynthesis protein [Glaciihabitans sp. dw_435]